MLFRSPASRQKRAYLLEKKLGPAELLDVLEQAKKDRADGMQVMIANMKKNKKFQKEQLAQQGYTDVVEVFCK